MTSYFSNRKEHLLYVWFQGKVFSYPYDGLAMHMYEWYIPGTYIMDGQYRFFGLIKERDDKEFDTVFAPDADVPSEFKTALLLLGVL